MWRNTCSSAVIMKFNSVLISIRLRFIPRLGGLEDVNDYLIIVVLFE